ncbi:hypothetical protein [Reyranella sp.]|jgi:hypothetical protein|uniref:hypothetical protein n=1 Tax=Reyranella sp. TaxID=1929291 RepID=UPI003BAAF44B
METARTLLEDIAQYFGSPATPRDQLDLLRRDRLDAEAEIRSVLDRLASKYDLPSEDVDETMSSIGAAIGDMTYEPETEYLEDIDGRPPL